MGGGVTIPLPAVTPYRPEQQPGPLDQYAKLVQLRSAMQEQQLQQGQIQMQQQQIKDQQAITGAAKGWDGQDYDSLAKSVLQNGGSGNAAFQIQQHGLAIKKQVSDIAASDATTGSKNLETYIGKHKAVGDALEGSKDIPDDQLHRWAVGTVTDLAKNGILDPQMGQQLIQGVQSIQDPKALRGQIDVFAKTSMGAKAVAEQQKEQSDLAAKQAQLPGQQAESGIKQAELKAMQTGGGAAGTGLDVQEANAWLRKNPSKDLADYAKYKATLVPAFNFNLQNAGATGGPGGQPSAIAQAIANNQMRWSDAVSPRTPMSVKLALLSDVKKVNPNYNSGDFQVEQAVKTEATSGAVGKQLLAIGTAREHMKTFSQLADALDNGNVQLANKIGNAFGVQFGSDKKTNFDIAAQAFGGEVGRAFDGAGVVAGERKEAENNYNAAMSKGQFKGAIQIVDRLLAGKQKAAHDWFDQGVQAKPDFGQTGAQPATGNAQQLTGKGAKWGIAPVGAQ